jgi:LmbE family N-acetylglucosaminyl deacetylase
MNNMPAFKEPLIIPNEKILIFEPHPDDIAFQISGTVCKWIEEKKDVIVCTITTGNSSNMDPTISKEEIEKIMMEEHKNALDFYGIPIENRIQWKYNDWGIDPTRDRITLLIDMVRLIKKVKPTTVVTMDPLNINMEENSDHRSVAMTGFEAAAMASYPDAIGNAVNNPQLINANDRDVHHVSRVLFYMSPNPNVFVDVGGELMDKKKTVGCIYKSQLKMMIEEVDARLRPLGLDPEIKDVNFEELWSGVCESYAKAHASEAAAYYKTHPNLAPRVYPEFAEAFRLYYLGAVEKLRDLLPKELLTL